MCFSFQVPSAHLLSLSDCCFELHLCLSLSCSSLFFMMHPYAFLLSAVLALLACPTTHSLIFPSLSKPLWSSLNSEISPLLPPLHSALSKDQISPSDDVAASSSTITTFLKSKSEFSSPLSQRFITHASHALKQLKSRSPFAGKRSHPLALPLSALNFIIVSASFPS